MPINELRIRQIFREELKALMPPKVPELYTPEEAAKLLKVTIGTLAQWRTAGIGPKYFKAGGIKYELRDINSFLDGAAQ